MMVVAFRGAKMSLQKSWRLLTLGLPLLVATASPSVAERIDRGTQVIDGTSVRTTIYHDRGYAIFENECGRQSLSQSALQGGAKPDNIIPCPRRSATPPVTPAPRQSEQSTPGGRRYWSAVAAGIDNGLLGVGARVSAGHAENRATKADAEADAVRACEKNVSSCKVVTAWNSGCYFITVSKNSSPVAWGAGPTANAAYQACYDRINSGNCDTQTLGNCYPE